MREDIRLGHDTVGLANDNCRDAFAEIRMRQPDNGGLRDAGNLIDLALDLLGIDIEAA